jgi:hypothetical protein
VSFGATSMEFQSFIEEIWPKQCRVETCFWLQIFPHMTTSLKRTVISRIDVDLSINIRRELGLRIGRFNGRLIDLEGKY